MTDPLTLANDDLAITVSALGAELRSLVDAQGRDWLWDGDPAFWTGRAPLLFPVIGAVAGGVIRVDGVAYPMPKHGFARGRTFEVAAQDAASITFALAADDATRAAYPYDFLLEIRYALDGATLIQTATIHNRGNRPMPASFGFHPALRWPLPGGGARTDHILRFDSPEREPIRRIDADGLISPDVEASPVEERDLALRDALFEADALIFDRLSSRSLWYGAPDYPGVAVSFPGLPHLGVWTKPGAGYLCIEPWQGHADPAGFAGELADKPGVAVIPARSSIDRSMTITIGVDNP